MDIPNPKNSPPEIGTQGEWIPNKGMDTAARVAYNKFYYDLPKITAGKAVFVWPSGIEGFRRSGSSTLGIHKFLGRNYVSVSEVHKDEAHIELSGTFFGITSAKNMRDLIDVLIASGPKLLYLPGVLTKAQTVYCLDYDYTHDADDQTHSIGYTITFVRTTVGPSVKARTSAVALASISSSPRSNQSAPVKNLSERTITIQSGSPTLRGLANTLYGDSDKWKALVDLNGDVFAQYNPGATGMDKFQLSLARLPFGTVLRY